MAMRVIPDRFRLKADFDISTFSEPVQVILRALKKYGRFVADNGSNWYISGASDDRWDDDILCELKSISGANFEAVQTVHANGDPIYPVPTAIHQTEFSDNPVFICYYPNPFNASVTIKYRLRRRGNISVKIFNLQGQEVFNLFNGYQNSGEHQLQWHAVGFSSGIYFYRFQGNGLNKTGRLVLQK